MSRLIRGYWLIERDDPKTVAHMIGDPRQVSSEEGATKGRIAGLALHMVFTEKLPERQSLDQSLSWNCPHTLDFSAGNRKVVL